MPIIRIEDRDTKESDLCVVMVPEGFSIQISYKDPSILGDLSYVSVIVNPTDAEELAQFLLGPIG